MECGPTCLRMVMAYYGRNYPLERLRDMCHIQRDGVSLLGVAEAAEQLGMHTTGVKATLQQLVDEVPLPCILHWNQAERARWYRPDAGANTRFQSRRVCRG